MNKKQSARKNNRKNKVNIHDLLGVQKETIIIHCKNLIFLKLKPNYFLDFVERSYGKKRTSMVHSLLRF